MRANTQRNHRVTSHVRVVTVAHAWCVGWRRAIKLCTHGGKKRVAAELESPLSSRPRVVPCVVLLEALMRGCAMLGYQSMSHKTFLLFCFADPDKRRGQGHECV